MRASPACWSAGQQWATLPCGATGQNLPEVVPRGAGARVGFSIVTAIVTGHCCNGAFQHGPLSCQVSSAATGAEKTWRSMSAKNVTEWS